MVTLKKILSALLILVLLVAATGISFSRHVCISDKSAPCTKNMNCCKHEQAGAKKNLRCCSVRNFYFKANIVTTHYSIKYKFFPENFIAFFYNHFYISSSQVQYAGNDLIRKPPSLRSSRSILLDSSRLTV
jgi:hypothetical protein